MPVTPTVFIPAAFVLLWSTGFTISKLGLPYAEPLTFLGLRFAVAAMVLAGLIGLLPRWRSSAASLTAMQVCHCAVVGVLIHATYLGGVFSAIARGVDAGLCALIACLQPVLTVVLSAAFLGETITRRKLAGTALGFVGVCVVLLERGIGTDGTDAIGLLLAFLALAGITLGTLYQKRFVVDTPHMPSVAIQYVAAGVALLPLAMLGESMHIDWTPTFVFAFAWLVLVLSLGAVFLLMVMIRRGEVSKVASYIYLVPPLVVIQAWFLFGERLSGTGLAGIALCVLGVSMVTRR